MLLLHLSINANVRGVRHVVKNHHSTTCIISTRANDGGAATSMLPWTLYCNDQASIPTLVLTPPCVCDHAKPQPTQYAPAAADGTQGVCSLLCSRGREAWMGCDVISKIKINGGNIHLLIG